MVDGVLMSVLNPSMPVSISVNSCEQVYLRIILQQHLCNPSNHYGKYRRFTRETRALYLDA